MNDTRLAARLDAIFKAYDIRGRVPGELDDALAYDIARAYASFLQPATVVVGRDVRLTSASLARAVARGLNDAGVDVIDIGVGGTEEVYFATVHAQADGGIMVTASHNPMDWNGLKLVREQARPISADTGLADIRRLVEQGLPAPAATPGTVATRSCRAEYVQHLLGYVDVSQLHDLVIVADPGNGGAGLVLRELEPHLPFRLVRVNFEADGTFPNGVPNPMLEPNRAATAHAVRESGADMGVAWDGDFDRCFLFDSDGNFVDAYYIIGLLSRSLLAKDPGGRIVHDPRLTWNTREVVEACGGSTVLCRSGHAFVKQVMRDVDAVYGGEMSAHHYFRDFAYCDSGMIPWLLIAELVSRSGRSLADMVKEMQSSYPVSGEINFEVPDPAAVVRAAEKELAASALNVDRTDGLSLDFEDWRFNLRPSNTEPYIRLNVETRSDRELLQERVNYLSRFVQKHA